MSLGRQIHIPDKIHFTFPINQISPITKKRMKLFLFIGRFILFWNFQFSIIIIITIKRSPLLRYTVFTAPGREGREKEEKQGNNLNTEIQL